MILEVLIVFLVGNLVSSGYAVAFSEDRRNMVRGLLCINIAVLVCVLLLII